MAMRGKQGQKGCGGGLWGWAVGVGRGGGGSPGNTSGMKRVIEG